VLETINQELARFYMTIPMEYPRMMYHKTAAPKAVPNKAAEEALGKDWARKRFPVIVIVPASEPADLNYSANERDMLNSLMKPKTKKRK
jgi:hypothetical protein